jgi:hypothetical protein
MPLKYWDEAFLAVTYLINRLPTKTLDFSSPLECLFREKPSYLGLRTFGYACWPNLRPFNTHKLQFRSKQCVFLRYSNIHKGLKCLNVAEGRIYISHDVVFDETGFPFSKLNPNVGARLRADILLLPTISQPSTIPGPGVEFSNDPCVNVQLNHVSTNPPDSHAVVARNHVDFDAEIGPGRGVLPSEVSDLVPDADLVPAEDSSAHIVINPDEDTTRSSLEMDLPALSTAGRELPTACCVVSSSVARVSSSGVGHAASASSAAHGSASGADCGSSVAGPSTPTPSDSLARIDTIPVSNSSSTDPAPARPSTCLQHGICKPKVYTDGIVRYGFLASSGSLAIIMRH